MLKDFIPPYDATVIEIIKNADGIIIGKIIWTNLPWVPTLKLHILATQKNPLDLERTPGGSSGGSAAGGCCLRNTPPIFGIRYRWFY